MSNNTKNELRIFKPINIYIGIGIGLLSTIHLAYNTIEQSPREILDSLSSPSWTWIGLAFLALFTRDFFYILRIKVLTNNKLDWIGSVYTIMLWEFASCVTPSVVGGTAVAIYILKKEGIKTGKSIAIVMTTAILDNLFFIIAAPIFILLISPSIEISNFFYYSYYLIALYTLFMAFGVLINPKAFKNTLSFIGKIFPIKWQKKLHNLTTDVQTASLEIKKQTFSYWFISIGCTIIVWMSRYFIVNCIIAAYQEVSFTEHFSILSKHIVLWISQLVSPTPGGAGLAEFFITKIMGIDIGKATLWRGFTYYLYIIIGVIVLPKWLKRVFN